MEQIGKELTRELIETVRKEARRAHQTYKPLVKQILSVADAAWLLPDAGVPRECGVAAALYYGTEVFLVQYQQLLEKLTAYRQDVTDILQMVKEISRRVDDVVEKACYSN
jgi:gas vesicle protein